MLGRAEGLELPKASPAARSAVFTTFWKSFLTSSRVPMRITHGEPLA